MGNEFKWRLKKEQVNTTIQLADESYPTCRLCQDLELMHTVNNPVEVEE